MSSAKEPSSPKKSASPGGKGKGKRKSGANKKKRRSNKGKFRETMWFKKGQLDAEAAKRAATGQDKQGLPESDKADEMPMEDRYADDGSLSHEDKDKFSLRTGHTEMMAAIPDQPKSAAGVSEDDLVREMQGGRGKYIAAIVVGVVALIGLIVMFASGGGGSDDEEEKTPDAAPAAKKQPVKKPVKKAPTIPKEATAAAAGFAKACVAGDAAAGWALLGPELQKKLYNDPVAKNRKYRRWRARIGYKGKAAKLDGKTYFALLMKKQSKWSPCSNADKFDVKGVKHDKDTLTMASSATEGPKALTFMKVGDKWLLTAIAWNKNK